MFKLKKSLAVLLAIIMLASFTPLFASAATSLTKTRCVLVEAPKLSYNGGEASSTVTVPRSDTAPTWGDFTVVGGKITYEGKEIEGYFDIRSNYKTRSLSIGDNSPSMTFYPTDTTTYASATWTSTTSSPLAGWPVVVLLGLECTIEEAPTGTLLNGYATSMTTFTGGKVVDSEGNDITSLGKWSVVTRTTPTETAQHEVKWVADGYTVVKTMATITVECETATLVEAPVVSNTLMSGSNTSSASVTGGKVIDADGNDITANGSWIVDSSKYKEYGVGSKMYINQYVPFKWYCPGYDIINITLLVKVSGVPENYLLKKMPEFGTFESTVTYTANTKYGDIIPITPGELVDITTGEAIPGKWAVTALGMYGKESTLFMGTRVIYITFIPEDTSAVSYIQTVQSSMTVNKADFALADGCELVLNYGTAYDYSYSDDELKFSTFNTTPEDAGVKSVRWDSAEIFDPATADYGSVTMVEVTITANVSACYNNLVATIPVRIQPYTMTGNFISESSTSEAVAFMYSDDKDDGLITYLLDFTNKRLKGSVAITATDGTNTYDIATVTPDENNRFYVEDKWQAPADGNYVFTFTYTASEDDTAVFSNEKLKVITNVEGVDVDMKEFRTVTVKIGSTVYTEEVRESHVFTKLWSDLTEADSSIFDHWLITDENGNEITVKDSVGRDFDITDSVISIKVPEHDITITAISASGEAVDENATGGSLWSFWQKLVDWLVSLYRTIVELLIPTVETF